MTHPAHTPTIPIQTFAWLVILGLTGAAGYSIGQAVMRAQLLETAEWVASGETDTKTKCLLEGLEQRRLLAANWRDQRRWVLLPHGDE